MTAALRQQGLVCNRKRVARLMREHGLIAKPRRQRRVNPTDSYHAFPMAPNRLLREFSAERPNEKWVVDFTSIDMAAGWLYLALVLRVFSRKIVGWAMDEHRVLALVECALCMAFAQRRPPTGDLLQQSDRGSPYASSSY